MTSYERKSGESVVVPSHPPVSASSTCVVVVGDRTVCLVVEAHSVGVIEFPTNTMTTPDEREFSANDVMKYEWNGETRYQER